MGQIQSTPEPSRVYNTDPKRLYVSSLQCCACDADQPSNDSETKPPGFEVMVLAEYDRASKSFSATRSDQRPLTFVQDPEAGSMVLQLPYQPSWLLKFALSIALIPGNEQHRLFFTHAASAKELKHLIDSRQVGNWIEVGKWTEPRHPVIEKLSFSLVWDAQEDRLGGQPIYFAFFFDAVNPTLSTGGALWVSERPQSEFSVLYDSGTNQPIENLAPPTPISNSMLNSTNSPPGSPGSSGSQSFISASPQFNPSGSPQLAASNPGGANSTTNGLGVSMGTPGNAALRTVTSPRQSAENMPYGMPLQSPALPMARRPGAEHSFLPDDGPHFRSALLNMERRVPGLRARIKQLLKRSLITRERLEALIEADQWLASGIQEAANQECPSFQPVIDWFSRNSEGGLSSVQRQRKVTLNELTTRLIEPLQRFYEYDIKAFEQRKREFEEESNQFYSWTSRYLANRKEGKKGRAGETADAKFSIKKRAFDVARYDYFSYMSDLTIGLKQQVLLQLLTLATQSLTDSHIALGKEMASRTQPRVDAVVEDIKRAARLWESYRLEGQQLRKRLTEEITSEVDGSGDISYDRQGSPEALGSGSGSNVPINYKEGLLWASNRPGGHQETQVVPNKQSLQNLKWHKYWVVLDGSTLREYTNWKQSLVDLHNEPINLLIASVREARSSDRRFCFEVVTPQYKRVYQATCEDDARSWIAAINRSISTLLEASDEPPMSPSALRNADMDQLASPTTTGAANIIQALSGSSNASSTGTSSSFSTAASNVINSVHHGISSTLEGRGGQGKYQSLTGNISTPGGSALSRMGSRMGSRAMSENDKNLTHSHQNQKLLYSHQEALANLSLPENTNTNTNTSNSLSGVHHERPRIAPINTTIAPAKNDAIPVPMDRTQQQSTNSDSSNTEEWIRTLQRIPSNRYCAECRSTQGVEWVSINLLVVMCIECSGAHRSLGSHISKVRSLKLDTGAFTPSLRAALLSVSNEKINSIWEAKVPPSRKISSDASSSARKKFITEKYVEKQYINELEKPNAVLRRSIKEQNIQLICAALASRANPNSVSDADEPLVIDALRSVTPSATVFPAAEVLLKNGAALPDIIAYAGLNANALEYLSRKAAEN